MIDLVLFYSVQVVFFVGAVGAVGVVAAVVDRVRKESK